MSNNVRVYGNDIVDFTININGKFKRPTFTTVSPGSVVIVPGCYAKDPSSNLWTEEFFA